MTGFQFDRFDHSNETSTLEQKLLQAQKREQYCQQQKRILLHEQSQLDRKKRNHRIFTRGGMLEAFMKKPLLLTDDQVYRLLQTAFNTWEVREKETSLIEEAERRIDHEADERGAQDRGAEARGTGDWGKHLWDSYGD